MDDSNLVYNRQGTFLTDKGNLIGLRMKLWQFPSANSKDFPEGYKLSWIVFNLATENERILFDNHWGKPPHYHENGKEKFLEWISVEHAEELFYQMVYKRFGYFNYE
jgi:hypothetical protein